MLVFRQHGAGSPRIVTRCLSFIARDRLHRRYCSTSRTETGADISDRKLPRAGKLKTRKSFASLPKRLQLSNGEYAECLPAWNGGIVDKTQKLEGESQNTLDRVVSDKVMNVKARRIGNSRKKPATAAPSVSRFLCQPEGMLDAVTDSTLGSPAPRNQLAREVQENLARYPHCILLTRVGQFYESYFDQAPEVSQLLSIKLAKKTWDGQRVSMCGFPVIHLERYLKVLVQQNKRSVALCEEFPKAAGGEARLAFERRVARIVTPGTLIDESFLNHHENNFLLAVHIEDLDAYKNHLACQSDTSSLIGIAWIDVSTGELFTRSSAISDLKDHLSRISPREVVIDNSLKELDHPLHAALQGADYLISCVHVNGQYSSPHLQGRELGSLGNGGRFSEGLAGNELDNPLSIESKAVRILHRFLQENLLDFAPKSLVPCREDKANFMQIDAQTLGALEIRKNTREGGTSGSLITTIKRTVTAGGARLLSRWLCFPSTSFDEIRARQEIVSLFSARPELREEFLQLLKSLDDATKISQKFLLGKGDFSDLKSIQHTINIWNTMKQRFAFEQALERKEDGPCFKEGDWKELDRLMSQVVDLGSLARRIEVAIQNEGAQRDVEDVNDENGDIIEMVPTYASVRMYGLPGKEAKWTVKSQFSLELTNLHRRLEDLQLEKAELESGYQKQYDAPSLSLRHSPGHGMIAHIAKPKRDSERLLGSKKFEQVSETKSSRVFFNKDWTLLGNAILETVVAISNAERLAFLALRNEVNEQSHWIRHNAKIFDELDVLCAFARLACEMNFVRPIINDRSSISITNGRHPNVERGLLESGKMFTSNSVTIEDASRLHIITGPNMGGKSTFLRQTALIAILAQTGSFVPADSAEIGIIDKIFSRIGAQDDLFRDRSTFMVEMLESADILKNATSRSLVIMDEVGRGTTIRDGLAIAFAIVHYLYHVTRCKALFATHFHELVDILGFCEGSQMSELYPAVQFSCTNGIETEEGRFTYSYQMGPGVNRDSHGIMVARLAGMPPSVTTLAENVLMELKQYKESWVDSTALHQLGQQYSKQ